MVFSNHILSLPVKYNFQHGFLKKIPGYDYWKYEKEVEEARKNPVIVHYTLGKPWEKTVPDTHPFTSTFTKYQRQTVWKNWTVTGRDNKAFGSMISTESVLPRKATISLT